MSNHVRIASLALLLLAAASQAETLHYLAPDAIDAVRLLPAPPAVDSDEARAERELMLTLQRQRTAGQTARCRSEVKVTLAAFARVLGPWFTVEKLPGLAQLLKRAEHDALFFADAAKNHYQRKRPAAEDPRIQIAVENEATPAYPSCHATRGMLFAEIIAQLAPQQEAALLERGREIGWDRVIAGMHHPSDIFAGRVIGQAAAQALLANPRFQQELAAARAEFERAPRQRSPAAQAP